MVLVLQPLLLLEAQVVVPLELVEMLERLQGVWHTSGRARRLRHSD